MWLSKYLKWLNQPPSTLYLRQSKPDANEVKGKNCSFHLINYFGWPSLIFHDLLNFVENPFYIYLKTYYTVNPFYHGFLIFFFNFSLTLKNCQSNYWASYPVKLRRPYKRSNTYVNCIHVIYLNEIRPVSKLAWANFRE